MTVNILLPDALLRIVQDLSRAGYRAMVVGGAVRDALLGLRVKDFDVEVYGVSYDRLAELLASYGRADLVGRSFGVIKLTARGPETQSRDTWDFSIPRRESK